MVYTHGNFGTSYINPQVHKILNKKIKNNEVFSLPRIKRGQSLSKSNYGRSFKSFSGTSGSVKKLRKGINRRKFEKKEEKMYPYSLFEKVMNVKA